MLHWLLLACAEDPILERAAELAPAGAHGAPSPTAPAPGQAPAPSAGQPSEPPPGGAVSPGPGTPGAPRPGVPEEPAPGGGPAVEGPSTLIRGTITVQSWRGGPIRVDVFDGDQRDLTGPRPSVLGGSRLDRPGDFELRVPTSAPRVWIGAFADEDRNGRPDPSDPAAWYSRNPLSTASDQGGVMLELKADPEDRGKGMQ